jgi:Domain of unknown function (DUF6531)
MQSHVSLDRGTAGKILATAKRNRAILHVLSKCAIDMAKRVNRIVCLGAMLLFVVLGSNNASAEISPISQAVTLRADGYLEFLTSRGWFSSKEKACEAFSGWYGERWPPGPYNFQVHPQGHLCGVWAFIFASNMCPINSELVENRCECKRGFAETSTPGACTAIPKEVPANSCTAGLLAGHPVAPAVGEKFRSEMDFIDGGPSPLALIRTYRSNWGADPNRKIGALGKAWIHNHEITIRSGFLILQVNPESSEKRWGQQTGRPSIAQIRSRKQRMEDGLTVVQMTGLFGILILSESCRR